jgi:hypothetical protein
MNGRILRRRGDRCSVLDLERSIRDKIAWLGHEAQTILTAQNQEIWKEAPYSLPLP